MANIFQRSSSQVEGRNGYLAFIHHAQKGIPKQKMKALTVIHNFDAKRQDSSTLAHRPGLISSKKVIFVFSRTD